MMKISDESIMAEYEDIKGSKKQSFCRVVHYVVPESITNPAVYSQAIGTVITLRRELKMPVIYYGLVKGDDARLSQQNNEVISMLQQEGVETHIYDNPRRYGTLATLNTLRRIVGHVRDSLREHPGPVLARNLFGAMMAYFATRGISGAYYIVDLRGHSGAEFEISGWMRAGSFKARLFYRWEQFLLENARAIFCVSRPLVAYVQAVCRIVPPCFVVPSCLSSSFIDPVGSYDAKDSNDKLVLAYVGTVTDWNQVDPMIELFKRLHTLMTHVEFLFLTTHEQQAQDLFAAHAIPKEWYHLIQVPHDEIKEALQAADIGLLLRDNSMVNRVASPVKLAEYLASGLALIVTDGIGDTSEILTKENVGLFLPSIDPNSWDDALLDHFLQSVITDRKGYRKRAVQTAARYFTRADYEKSYRAALFGESVSE